MMAMLDNRLWSDMRKVFSKSKPISKAILFGSRAKGNARENSDVDIAVLGCKGLFFCENMQDKLNELPTLLKFDVIDYHDIKNIKLKEHIDRVGIAIYERMHDEPSY